MMHNANMAVTDRIEWFEGMLLSPQHFQQMASRIDSLVAWQTLAAAPFSWGVRRLVFDHGLLPAGLLRVLELDAIMPDGTAVTYSAEAEGAVRLELPLEPFAAALSNGPIDFYLVLPVAATMRRSAQVKRFRSSASAPVEDQVSDAPPADIPRLMPNLELAAGELPSAMHVYLRLGSLYKDNEVVRLGEHLPPLLEVARDNPLWTSVASLLGQLRGKAAFVARQTANPSSKVDDRLTQLELKDRLRSLLSALPLAEATLRTPHLHPLSLYLSLASLNGSLAMLKPGGLPPVPADYDHADPLSVFTPLLRSLRKSMSEVNEEYREHKFEFRHGAFEISLHPDWIGERLVVGLRGQSDRDLLAWMDGAVIGSQSVYASLRSRRVLGAARRGIDYAEDLGLRSGSGYLLFEVEAEHALVLVSELLVIGNPNEGASAQRPQEMLLFVKG
ncbi:UNVERIFIED_ORG: type VI secretion system protein ImpJ [Burkholderia sp. CF145]|uniref:type VI secretion system baseplate subunit TssK n=1 Tax=Paraburkholderia hospita TaxID=169430 RepID=UPI00027179BB|nr:type VI secretion system baseplate subunit TssK [Paraburkholderia hospita]EUC20030.1 type VI secretion protein, VC_A0114 family [Burkholderia sp. BT03]SKD06184.1 type VI secretion protein, VC_A0114 family [Paraburkholderia hospita]